MTEEKLVHQSTTTRSLLWGALWGSLATAAVGLLVLRPIGVVVSDPYPPLPPTSSADAPPQQVTAGSPSTELPAPPPEEIDAQSDEVGEGSLAQPAPPTLAPAAGTASPTPAPPSAAPTGGLRVSNQTGHPVRVALLPQAEGVPAQPVEGSAFGEPIHWDFAPQEGSVNGLRLSLPDGRQAIQSGDVLVVFAQDGSQRYWGPYVVGVTGLPAWQPEPSEWQLTIQSASPSATLAAP